MTGDFRRIVWTIAHLPASACTTSAPGSKSPLGRGGGGGAARIGVLSSFPVVGVRLCAATDRARGGNTGLADGGTGECVRACGALQLELVGTRCAAPTALPPCEPPVPLQACTRRARMPNEAAARGSQRNTGAGDGKERRWRTAGDAKKVHLSRRGVLAAGGGDNLRT